jgi:hypothetical protein
MNRYRSLIIGRSSALGNADRGRRCQGRAPRAETLWGKPESVDLGLVKTHLSLGFPWTHDDRAVHVGAGSAGGRGSAIIRRMSSNSFLGIGDFGHQEAT